MNNSPDLRPVKVYCTIYPLYDFARNIGKDKIDLSCLVPPGTGEPHGVGTYTQGPGVNSGSKSFLCIAGQAWKAGSIRY